MKLFLGPGFATCTWFNKYVTSSIDFLVLIVQTFNEFFIRELKPGVRPIAFMDRDDVAVCAADSRLMAFRNVEESTRLWIKVFNTI